MPDPVVRESTCQLACEVNEHGVDHVAAVRPVELVRHVRSDVVDQRADVPYRIFALLNVVGGHIVFAVSATPAHVGVYQRASELVEEVAVDGGRRASVLQSLGW